jgi:hypothetical protein
MKRITTRAELVELARELKVRPDWHEPGEENLTAQVHGTSFDNAMPAGEWYGAGADGVPSAELHVILYRVPSWSDSYGSYLQPLAIVNLATLFAWATGLDRADEDASRLLEMMRKDWAELRTMLHQALKVDPDSATSLGTREMVQRLIAGYVEPPY